MLDQSDKIHELYSSPRPFLGNKYSKPSIIRLHRFSTFVADNREWLGEYLDGDIFSRRIFLPKEKSPTITVASFFFRQTTELIAYVPLFTETDKFTQVSSTNANLLQRVPFRFLPFLRNLQNRKIPKGPPFQFFFGTVRIFFRKFLIFQKSPPYGFFDILQQKVC